jgi:undecaprenyl phosphate-alpha-L-ara4N flippase subunit ArnE
MNVPKDLHSKDVWVPYLLALASIILSSMAQILLKLLVKHQSFSISLLSRPLFYIAFLAYGLSALIWLNVLAKLPLVVAYPLVSLNFVFVALGAALFLHERLSWPMLVGFALIFSGILVITKG